MARDVRAIGERRLYAAVAILALLVLYLVVFVVQNATRVKVSFVLFDAEAPLILVMTLCALLGGAIGAALWSIVHRVRDRATVDPSEAPTRRS